MIHIVYISRAVHPLSDQELQALLEQCQRDNQARNVTGVLFYSHGNIAQLIEGEREVLEPLFAAIARDGRHSNVQKLVDKPIEARSFPGWSMAFHPLEAEGFASLAGYLQPTQLGDAPSSLSIADALLVDLVRLAVFGPGTEASETETEAAHA